MVISEQWQMPLAVLGLLLLLLFIASILRKYQNYKAQLRISVRRVESAIPLVTEALDNLSAVPLSHALRVALRGDIYSRLQTIHKMYRSSPHIVERLKEAKIHVENEGASVAKTVPPIENEQHMGALTRSLDNLVDFFERGGPINHLRTENRLAFRDELKERRAEIIARYHMVQANRFNQAGDVNSARKYLNRLVRILKERGPKTDFVQELLNQTAQMLQSVGTAKILLQGGDEADSSSA